MKWLRSLLHGAGEEYSSPLRQPEVVPARVVGIGDYVGLSEWCRLEVPNPRPGDLITIDHTGRINIVHGIYPKHPIGRPPVAWQIRRERELAEAARLLE